MESKHNVFSRTFGGLGKKISDVFKDFGSAVSSTCYLCVHHVRSFLLLLLISLLSPFYGSISGVALNRSEAANLASLVTSSLSEEGTGSYAVAVTGLDGRDDAPYYSFESDRLFNLQRSFPDIKSLAAYSPYTLADKAAEKDVLYSPFMTSFGGSVSVLLLDQKSYGDFNTFGYFGSALVTKARYSGTADKVLLSPAMADAYLSEQKLTAKDYESLIGKSFNAKSYEADSVDRDETYFIDGVLNDNVLFDALFGVNYVVMDSVTTFSMQPTLYSFVASDAGTIENFFYYRSSLYKATSFYNSNPEYEFTFSVLGYSESGQSFREGTLSDRVAALESFYTDYQALNWTLIALFLGIALTVLNVLLIVMLYVHEPKYFRKGALLLFFIKVVVAAIGFLLLRFAPAISFLAYRGISLINDGCSYAMYIAVIILLASDVLGVIIGRHKVLNSGDPRQI
jgi:hypothetical protein